MRALDTGQPQDLFAKDAFFINVRFSILSLILLQHEEIFDAFPKGAKGLVFPSSFDDVS